MSDYSPRDRISQDSSLESERKSRKGVIIALICIVCVIIAVIIAVIALKPKDSGEQSVEEERERSVLVTPDNVDELLEEAKNSKISVGSYEVNMNTEWEFENGQSASSNAYIGNSVSNSNAMYFDITRSDTGEIIYSSPIIPVGSYLEQIVLDKELPAGTYACVVDYHLVDDDQNDLGSVKVNLTIHVAQ